MQNEYEIELALLFSGMNLYSLYSGASLAAEEYDLGLACSFRIKGWRVCDVDLCGVVDPAPSLGVPLVDRCICRISTFHSSSFIVHPVHSSGHGRPLHLHSISHVAGPLTNAAELVLLFAAGCSR